MKSNDDLFLATIIMLLVAVALITVAIETTPPKVSDIDLKREFYNEHFMHMSYGYVNENYGYGDMYMKTIMEYPLTKDIYPDKDEWIEMVTKLNNLDDSCVPGYDIRFFPVYEIGMEAGVSKILK